MRVTAQPPSVQPPAGLPAEERRQPAELGAGHTRVLLARARQVPRMPRRYRLLASPHAWHHTTHTPPSVSRIWMEHMEAQGALPQCSAAWPWPWPLPLPALPSPSHRWLLPNADTPWAPLFPHVGASPVLMQSCAAARAAYRLPRTAAQFASAVQPADRVPGDAHPRGAAEQPLRRAAGKSSRGCAILCRAVQWCAVQYCADDGPGLCPIPYHEDRGVFPGPATCRGPSAPPRLPRGAPYALRCCCAVTPLVGPGRLSPPRPPSCTRAARPQARMRGRGHTCMHACAPTSSSPVPPLPPCSPSKNNPKPPPAPQEMLDMLRDHQNNYHNVRLEWIVIWLIVVEVVVGLFELLGLFGLVGHEG